MFRFQARPPLLVRPASPSSLARAVDGMITIAIEPLTHGLIHEMRPLIDANHRDAAGHERLLPDWMGLVALPLVLWVMRDEGQPVGYCAHLVQPHMYFTGSKKANAMAIYILDSHRGSVPKFISHIEQWLLADGVASINYMVPHHSRAACFFEAIGYECTELVMTKQLHALPV